MTTKRAVSLWRVEKKGLLEKETSEAKPGIPGQIGTTQRRRRLGESAPQTEELKKKKKRSFCQRRSIPFTWKGYREKRAMCPVFSRKGRGGRLTQLKKQRELDGDFGVLTEKKKWASHAKGAENRVLGHEGGGGGGRPRTTVCELLRADLGRGQCDRFYSRKQPRCLDYECTIVDFVRSGGANKSYRVRREGGWDIRCRRRLEQGTGLSSSELMVRVLLKWRKFRSLKRQNIYHNKVRENTDPWFCTEGGALTHSVRLSAAGWIFSEGNEVDGAVRTRCC